MTSAYEEDDQLGEEGKRIHQALKLVLDKLGLKGAILILPMEDGTHIAGAHVDINEVVDACSALMHRTAIFLDTKVPGEKPAPITTVIQALEVTSELLESLIFVEAEGADTFGQTRH